MERRDGHFLTAEGAAQEAAIWVSVPKENSVHSVSALIKFHTSISILPLVCQSKFNSICV